MINNSLDQANNNESSKNGSRNNESNSAHSNDNEQKRFSDNNLTAVVDTISQIKNLAKQA